MQGRHTDRQEIAGTLMALFQLSTMLSENRFPLWGIML
jgi:hypothetical protein